MCSACINCLKSSTHTIHECMKAFKEQRNEFMKFTGEEEIDIIKNGGYYNTMYIEYLKLQYKNINNLQFDLVNEIEYDAIENSSTGAYIYCRDNFIGNVYSFDINSLYLFF